MDTSLQCLQFEVLTILQLAREFNLNICPKVRRGHHLVETILHVKITIHFARIDHDIVKNTRLICRCVVGEVPKYQTFGFEIVE